MLSLQARKEHLSNHNNNVKLSLQVAGEQLSEHNSKVNLCLQVAKGTAISACQRSKAASTGGKRTAISA